MFILHLFYFGIIIIFMIRLTKIYNKLDKIFTNQYDFTKLKKNNNELKEKIKTLENQTKHLKRQNSNLKYEFQLNEQTHILLRKQYNIINAENNEFVNKIYRYNNCVCYCDEIGHSNNDIKNNTNIGEIYLIRPDPEIKTNKDRFRQLTNKKVFKIGMSAKNTISRVKAHGVNSQIILIISCTNPKKHEKKLLKIFNNKFNLAVGHEYFHGDEGEMRKIILQYFYGDQCSSVYKLAFKKIHNLQ